MRRHPNHIVACTPHEILLGHLQFGYGYVVHCVVYDIAHILEQLYRTHFTIFHHAQYGRLHLWKTALKVSAC